VSLQTPDSVRRLQRALYVKAKTEPAYRFYLLYDKVYRDDMLHHAYRVSRAADGARTPGVDDVTFEDIEAAGQEEWLAGLKQALQEKTYQPDAVRRVLIPKPGGGERPLGIPTVTAYCVRGQQRFGLAAYHPSLPSARWPTSRHSLRTDI